MSAKAPFPAEGGCDCRLIRYRLESEPLFVHCCHCRWCQRETGASFALNAMIESDRVSNLGAEPELVHTPSDSGLGQKIARCPRCRVAVWSHYAGSGPVVRFVRVGTLDNPDLLPPNVHIFTASKQPWVVIPAGTPAFEAYYERESLWPPASLARRAAILPLIEAWKASQRGDVSDRRYPLAMMASDAPARTKPSIYPEPFASRMAGREKRPLGDLFGLANFGINLTRLAPNAVSALRHAHTRQDEFVYILQGFPTLHTDEGRTRLAPGMCAAFRAGTGDAHRLVNETSADVVYLEVGDRLPGDEVSYPDDDLRTTSVDGRRVFVHKDGTPYA